MKENIGMVDRMIRFIIAIIFIILGFVYSPWWFIVAAIALITAILGWCGIYSLFGCNTCSTSDKLSTKTVAKPKKVAKKKKK
ncbi:MAG: YgaP family membrane protein [Candidatus Woesearchaeota archaeon]